MAFSVNLELNLDYYYLHEHALGGLHFIIR